MAIYRMKIRFSLRALLIAATVLILFLGYSQSRRQRIIRRCEWFGKQGFYLDVPNDFTDWIWQGMPKHGHLSTYNYGVLFHGLRVGNEYQRVAALAQEWMDEFPNAMWA